MSGPHSCTCSCNTHICFRSSFRVLKPYVRCSTEFHSSISELYPVVVVVAPSLYTYINQVQLNLWNSETPQWESHSKAITPGLIPVVHPCHCRLQRPRVRVWVVLYFHSFLFLSISLNRLPGTITPHQSHHSFTTGLANLFFYYHCLIR